MCESGINVLIGRFREVNLRTYRPSSWIAVGDGFSPGSGAPQLIEEDCPTCGRTIPVVKRTLESVV